MEKSINKAIKRANVVKPVEDKINEELVLQRAKLERQVEEEALKLTQLELDSLKRREAKINLKRSKDTKVAEYIAKNNKMIRGQFLTYTIQGLKEMQLTYKIDEGNVVKRHVMHGDILELPFGYIKHLNTHGTIQREEGHGLDLTDVDGNKMRVNVEDNEQRYSFRILDVLSREEMLELEPSTIVRANLV